MTSRLFYVCIRIRHNLKHGKKNRDERIRQWKKIIKKKNFRSQSDGKKVEWTTGDCRLLKSELPRRSE